MYVYIVHVCKVCVCIICYVCVLIVFPCCFGNSLRGGRGGREKERGGLPPEPTVVMGLPGTNKYMYAPCTS